jgi:hypothetical protein
MIIMVLQALLERLIRECKETAECSIHGNSIYRKSLRWFNGGTSEVKSLQEQII